MSAALDNELGMGGNGNREAEVGLLGILGGREERFILLEGPPKQRDRQLGCK